METNPDVLWRPWIERVAGAVDVDPAEVSVAEIHALTREVSDRFDRPMAPVTAAIWGLARASHPARDPAELRDALLAVLPREAP